MPQISTRDTQTTVALAEDQTLVIGGLIQDNTTTTGDSTSTTGGSTNTIGGSIG